MKIWEEKGVWLDVWRKYMVDLDEETLLGREEAFIGGTFAPAKKRGRVRVGKTKICKGTKWMVVVDGKAKPLGSFLASASPAEATLVDQTLKQIKVPRNGHGRPKSRPKGLIADRGYDS